MSRVHGGVYIANPNGLRGDIISSPTRRKRCVVRLRGSHGTEIPMDDQELVEYTPDVSAEQPMTRQEENLRHHIYQKAQSCDAFYIDERILTMELGDEFTYLIVSNSASAESSSSTEKMPPEAEGKALVRILEAYYIGHGFLFASGRHLATFHRALHPFWKEDESSPGVFSKLQGETANDFLDQLQHIFAEATSGLVFFRAFCYAHHRLDYHQTVNKDDETSQESLLDAYCVAFYVIKLLEQQIETFQNMDFTPLVEEELAHYKSVDVDMSADDLLWCFGTLLLRIGSDLRRQIGLEAFNKLFPKPFDLAMNEELIVGQLTMELRKESPVSFLYPYRMIMDMKSIVPTPFRQEWIQSAYEFGILGLSAADSWGDPFFQYTFGMITAFWLPTTNHVPNAYSLAEIQARVEKADSYRLECEHCVPDYMLWVGKQHQVSLRMAMENFEVDPQNQLVTPLVDAYTYTAMDSPYRIKLKKPVDASKLKECNYCTRRAEQLLRCSRCSKVQYCSKSCQVAHWKESHSSECIPKDPASPHECGCCSKKMPQRKLDCSKCGVVSYCNRKCQLEHWKSGHKKECKKVMERKGHK